MGRRSDAGLLAEEYNPKTNGLMGSFPHPFSHVALETMALDISRQKGPAVRRSRSGASHKPIPVVVLGRRGLYLERDKTMSEITPDALSVRCDNWGCPRETRRRSV